MRAVARAMLVVLGLALPVRAAVATFPANLSSLPRGEIVSAIPALSDPTQTYELYLPTAFDPARRWPILFLFDPRARGGVAAELFRPAAEELGWILLSSNNTRSDGPGEPNQRAVDALFPDAFRRLPVDDRRIYAGGFSGGAVIAWSVGLVSRGLAGVISIGGRPEPAHAALAPGFALFAAAGVEDFNHQPTRALDAIAAKAGVPHRLEQFPGPHAWCPPETARRALVWLEVLAMRDGLAARDPEKIRRFLAEELGRARELEAVDPLAAARALEELATAFTGLVEPGPVDAARARSRELLAAPGTKAALKAEEEAARYELEGSRGIGDAIVLLRGDPPPPTARLRQVVGLAKALRRVEEGGERGLAARRHLEAIAVHLGFYQPNELMAKRNYRAALPSLEVAAEAKPTDPFLRYNLACARARTGDADGAVAALRSAVELGLPDPERMREDPDLESLRDQVAFRSLLHGLAAKP
jgi:dienelactone hydrolase